VSRRISLALGTAVVLILLPFAVLPAAIAEPVTTVTITGSLSGATGVVKLGGSVRGTPQELSGTVGSVHVSFGSPATFDLQGSLSGDVVTLSGTVTQAAAKFLIGTPVTLIANASTGQIDLVFGPIPSGPLAGETLTFSGTGQVIITESG
jgi:hypothetical protein